MRRVDAVFTISLWAVGAGLWWMSLVGSAPAASAVEVIAAIPHLDVDLAGVKHPRWVEVQAALPQLKAAGVTTLFIWAPYAHRFPDKGETIPVQTANGVRHLELGPCVHILDYLTPDPERGSVAQFRQLVNTAHELGLRVIAQLQITLAAPGDFVYEKHPEWLVKSIYGGWAVKWPWEPVRPGYIVNKAHPGLIKFVTNQVLPLWINDWGLDGVYLDSPGVAYCDPQIAQMCRQMGNVPGAEPLTPVAEQLAGPRPLVEAMRRRIDELAEQTRRRLTFAGEVALETWRKTPRRCIERAIRGQFFTWLIDPDADRSMGRYFDWVMSYTYRTVVNEALHDGITSTSAKYVQFFDLESQLDRRYTQVARFVNMWAEGHKYIDLLQPPRAKAALALWATAPGKVLFVGAYQLPPQDDVIGDRLLGWWPARRQWLARLVALKKQYPALASDKIENALLSPRDVKGLWAFNRWDGNEAITVVVNATSQAHKCLLRTRASGQRVRFDDVLSGQTLTGPAEAVGVVVKPQQVRVLVARGSPAQP